MNASRELVEEPLVDWRRRALGRRRVGVGAAPLVVAIIRVDARADGARASPPSEGRVEAGVAEVFA